MYNPYTDLLNNVILLTDSYKVSHYLQLPAKTQNIYSYFESRGGKHESTVFFGLQYILKRYLEGPVVSEEKIKEAKDLFKEHFGNPNLFNDYGWKRLLQKHKGTLPVRIKAIPEGTVVNTRNVLVTIENTDEEFPWLTGYIDSLLTQIWYPCAVATLSYYCKNMIRSFANINGDPDKIDFKLHDFGFRGVSSVESAMWGGMGHLLNFKGTDTLPALIGAKMYYHAKTMPGFSIPGAEHSTITSWGKENEVNAFSNILNQFPTGTVAVVSDSYDIYKACNHLWGYWLKDKVLARDGCLVVRPDSGNPIEIVNKVIEILGDRFGFTVNSKGYKVLNPKIRVIQGDGVNPNTIEKILYTMQENKWSVDNISFGMGGALLQKLNRDDSSFAFKCSAIKCSDEWNDVYKEPVTDSGKVSKSGRMKLVRVDSKSFSTVPLVGFSARKDELITVFENGELMRDYTFQECIDNLNKE